MTLRIAFFQNWSLLGAVVGERLARSGKYALWGVAPDVQRELRDPVLEAAFQLHEVPLRLIDPRATADLVPELEAFRPDLVLVTTFATKLPPEVLATARVDAINTHPALLPRYRGAHPEFWALRNGEDETGITLHRMTDRFDAGPILEQVRVEIRPDDSCEALVVRMVEPTWRATEALLARYEAGERPAGVPQDEARVTRAPMVRRDHLRIDWNDSAASILRLVRAARPWWRAFTTLRGADLFVLGASPGGRAERVDPGRVVRRDGVALVCAGDGELVRLDQVSSGYSVAPATTLVDRAVDRLGR